MSLDEVATTFTRARIPPALQRSYFKNYVSGPKPVTKNCLEAKDLDNVYCSPGSVPPWLCTNDGLEVGFLSRNHGISPKTQLKTTGDDATRDNSGSIWQNEVSRIWKVHVISKFRR